MFKKVIIPVMVLVGMSLMAFYTGKKERMVETPAEANEAADHAPVVVLELFTSQGCSSCPPADVLLEQMKKQYPEEVYALSYHVDYWNYIGWEDPFSKSVFTKKQRDYNLKFRYRSNYTPQLVINGKEHFVGSNRAKMYANIKEYRTKKSRNSVKLDIVETQKDQIAFDYVVEGSLQGKQLRAVLVLDERTTSVQRGENRNRTLKNSNIVVAEKYMPLKAGEGSTSIRIPGLVGANENLTLMALVEQDNLDIVGAAKKQLRR